MATVNKDFKVKHGLIVEGANATVDGSDIITEDSLTSGTQTNITVTYDAENKVVNFVAENGVADSTTDDLVEGTTNKYFTDQRAIDAVGGSATPNNEPDTVVKRDGNGDFAARTVSASSVNVASAINIGLVGSITNELGLQINSSPNNSLTLFGDQDLVLQSGNANIVLNPDGDAYLGSATAGNEVATAGDIDAHSDLTTGVHGVTGDVVGTSDSQTLTNKTLGSGTSLDSQVDANNKTITNLPEPIGISDAATKGYVDTAVSDLVSGAPELLDTLNELAAAIGDDENFAATVATDIGTKLSKAGDAMTGELAMGTNKITGLGAPTVETDAATKGYVDDNFVTLDDLPGQLDDYIPLTQKAANDGVATLDPAGQVPLSQLGNVTEAIDGLTTSDVAEGTNLYFTDARAVDALEAVVPNFTAIEVNSVAKQVAATVSVPSLQSTTAYSFLKTEYRSGKFLVKVAYETHTQISEVLLTLDLFDNIAVTEFAMVSTNGFSYSVDAFVVGNEVVISVTPNNMDPITATATVVGTLLI